MKNIYITTLITLSTVLGTSLTNELKAQTVTTVLTASAPTDDVAFDSAGNTYFETFTSVIRRNAMGVDTVLASGFNELQCMTIDSVGNLFVGDYGASIIYKILPNGTSSVFCTGVGSPTGLVFDKNGILYAANYFASSIYKVDNTGTATFFASIGGSRAAQMVMDYTTGDLYCNGYFDSKLYKITPAGVVTVVTTFPGSSCGLALGKEKDFYVTGYSSHQIYRLDSLGNISVYAGSGLSGLSDGPVATATMVNPSYIKFNSKGDLYFGDEGSNIFRKISNMYFLTFDLLQPSYCAGDSIRIPFQTTSDDSTGNVFTAELSDAMGNFGTPTTLGTLNGISSDTIHGVLPASLSSSNQYRVRVFSSDFADTAHTSGNFTISTTPVVHLGNDTTVCSPQTVLLDAGSAFTYLWSDVTTTQTLTATASGDYWVTVSNIGSCVSADTIHVTVAICTGISDNEQNTSAELYPNPFSTSTQFKLNTLMQLQTATLKIYDVLGKEIKHVEVNSSETTIDREGLENGVYFYKFYNNNYCIQTGKFIIN